MRSRRKGRREGEAKKKKKAKEMEKVKEKWSCKTGTGGDTKLCLECLLVFFLGSSLVHSEMWKYRVKCGSTG